MVTSAVSATIPTGEKSPYTIIFSGVYVVRLDGDRYGYDTDSFYGNWSPSTHGIVYSGAYLVNPSGDLAYVDYIHISYGRRSPSTRSTSASYVHFVYSYGDVTGYGEYNFPDYSYGYIFDYFCI